MLVESISPKFVYVSYTLITYKISFRTSTPISAQNVINGQQPANFQARQLPPQQPNQPVETVKFGHPSLSRQITQVTEQKENMPEINAKFESTLVSYSNSKNQLIEQMKQLALMTDLLDEKSTNFDTGE